MRSSRKVCEGSGDFRGLGPAAHPVPARPPGQPPGQAAERKGCFRTRGSPPLLPTSQDTPTVPLRPRARPPNPRPPAAGRPVCLAPPWAWLLPQQPRAWALTPGRGCGTNTVPRPFTPWPGAASPPPRPCAPGGERGGERGTFGALTDGSQNPRLQGRWPGREWSRNGSPPAAWGSAELRTPTLPRAPSPKRCR